MNKLNFQTLFFCITIVVNIQYSYSQTDFDYSALDGMDAFSRPDLFGQQYAAFNGLSRAEKMPIILDAIEGDKTDEIVYESGKFECGQFSRLTAVNIFGCKDFENYEYFNNYANQTVTNGKYNIPVFRVSTITQGSSSEIVTEISGHSINAIFVGPENPNEKPDPTNFNQWYFFEPQTDNEVRPGDFSMNKNGYAHIYWFGQSPHFITGELVHSDLQLLSFKLNNGIATLDPTFSGDGIRDVLLREDPHTLYVNMNDENMFVERGTNAPDLSDENLGTPSAQTNSTYSTPSVEKVGSKFTPFNENYPEYGVQENVYKGEISTGRWNGTNLESLVDSMKRRITVDDTTAPIVVAPKDTTVNKGSSLEVDVTGMASFSDASPYGVEMWYEDNIVSEDELQSY